MRHSRGDSHRAECVRECRRETQRIERERATYDSKFGPSCARAVARGTETGRARCAGCSLLAAAIAATPKAFGVALQFQLQMIQIRAATEEDRDAIWDIFHEIIG